MRKKVIAGTGHRPDKVFSQGYKSMNTEMPVLVTFAEQKLSEMEVSHVISGGAQGWDTALALAALNRGLELTMAIPCRGFERKWPVKAQELFWTICNKADQVIFIDETDYWKGPTGYHVAKMNIRNKWMTDHSEEMLALWNGTRGGTFNNVEYAQQVGKPVENVWDDWLKYRSGETADKQNVLYGVPTGTDGVDFINVYSKGCTELGRFASNFAFSPFECEFGRFYSIEGLWYWLGTEDDRLRALSGFAAKKLGRSLPKTHHRENFEEIIRKAISIKFETYPEKLRLLQECSLPLAHYYDFGGCRRPGGFEWILEHIDEIRRGVLVS